MKTNGCRSSTSRTSSLKNSTNRGKTCESDLLIFSSSYLKLASLGKDWICFWRGVANEHALLHWGTSAPCFHSGYVLVLWTLLLERMVPTIQSRHTLLCYVKPWLYAFTSILSCGSLQIRHWFDRVPNWEWTDTCTNRIQLKGPREFRSIDYSSKNLTEILQGIIGVFFSSTTDKNTSSGRAVLRNWTKRFWNFWGVSFHEIRFL
jgi:hypothetical protein